ncbi:hypothetical protein CaCOL14_006809 [Colletotrichum acutatum]|uniref:Cell cycle control protein n=1 Tax=Glomerella acutata TaxID=27357 RepID=A0AAD8XB05_GLOAC|nr:uncharacterized protein BDZ83DRAFT_633328 [Colletotrichum acutatum]KAK1718104.1 hypothetical protein BDZ83DRAFT_633328 [Colletotrichum acutatum]
MDTSRDSSNLLDTHNRLIADVLSRFRMLTMLATIQAEGERKNVEPQTIAVTGMSMQMEFEGLHTSIKDLLALSRRLKELWLFGKLGQGEGDARIQADKLQADVVRCAELLNAIQETRFAGLAAAAEGKWVPMGRADGSSGEGGPAVAAPPPAAPTAPNGAGGAA